MKQLKRKQKNRKMIFFGLLGTSSPCLSGTAVNVKRGGNEVTIAGDVAIQARDETIRMGRIFNAASSFN